MKYHQIERNLFIKNRAKFMANETKSVAVFNSNDICRLIADSTITVYRDLPLGRRSGKHSITFQMSYRHQNFILKKRTNTCAVWEGEKTNQRS
jgi:Xaa-Pro aminopeptidase